MKWLLNLIIGLSVDEQKEKYIKKNGYPKYTVRFFDNRGNFGAIIGTDTLMKGVENCRKILN